VLSIYLGVSGALKCDVFCSFSFSFSFLFFVIARFVRSETTQHNTTAPNVVYISFRFVSVVLAERKIAAFHRDRGGETPEQELVPRIILNACTVENVPASPFHFSLRTFCFVSLLAQSQFSHVVLRSVPLKCHSPGHLFTLSEDSTGSTRFRYYCTLNYVPVR
jgi:hypothetical protein